jgi:8-oxo-dGTP diphosphatase
MTQHLLAAYSILFLVKGDCILLLKRANTGFADGLYALPGGRVEAGETFRRALVREAVEELGIRINEDALKFVHVFQKRGTQNEFSCLVFKVTSWAGEPYNKEPAKASSVDWFELDQLPENLLDTHREVIDFIKHGICYSEHNMRDG